MKETISSAETPTDPKVIAGTQRVSGRGSRESHDTDIMYDSSYPSGTGGQASTALTLSHTICCKVAHMQETKRHDGQ